MRRRARAGWLCFALALVTQACGDSAGNEAVPDVAVTEPGGGGSGPVGLLPTGSDAGADAAATLTTPDAGSELPPPEAPPPDDARAVHLLVERDGALRVARVVPEGGYVGPVGAALPVSPASLDDTARPALWARDERPRVVVDLGDAGVYVGEGAAWTKLGEAPAGGGVTRFVDVALDVDRVLLSYSALDMMTFQYSLSGGVWSTEGAQIHSVEPYVTWQLGGLGVFDEGATRFGVRTLAGIEVRQSADGTETALLTAGGGAELVALFETSYIVGQPPYLTWLAFDGTSVLPPELAASPQWRVARIAGALHTDIEGRLHRLEDRAVVEVWPLASGMSAASVLGYAEGSRLVGLTAGSTGDAGTLDRWYVVLAPDGAVAETFAPEASVVEEEGGLSGVEWERRPTAVAWHVDAERVAVLSEVRHTYFRGAYGVSAALTEELWVIDGVGARTHRLAQHPPVEGTGVLPEFDRQWTFTGDGEHLVWNDGPGVHAFAIDTLEAVALREAF